MVLQQEIHRGRHVSEQPDLVLHRGDHALIVFWNRQPCFFHEGPRRRREILHAHAEQMLLVHPLAFLQIEAARRAVHILQRENFRQLGEGEDLPLGFGIPA